MKQKVKLKTDIKCILKTEEAEAGKQFHDGKVLKLSVKLLDIFETDKSFETEKFYDSIKKFELEKIY